MATFVLVAGAFHGAWAWKRVAEPLIAAGHEVHRLDLTGQGARAHNVTSETSLETHIEDVLAYVRIEELDRIVLVGHSYSGIVVTGAADRLGTRVRHLVYLDATVPENGQSAAGIAGDTMAQAAIRAANGHWLTPLFLPIEKMGPFASDEERDWFLGQVRPHPLRTFFDTISLQGGSQARRTFIHCTADPLGIFDKYAADARANPDWLAYEIPTGHDAMLTMPQRVAEILIEADALVQDPLE